jgi:hypothetical protein
VLDMRKGRRSDPVRLCGRFLWNGDTVTDPDWMTLAACRGQTELMFPERGTAHRKIRAARNLCAGCPVGVECEAWAHLHHVAYGIWNGKHAKDLSHQRNSRPGAAA